MSTTETSVSSDQTKANFYATFFLCLFLGVFGAHRFYNGKIKTGALELVTCGGLGIWWFVDLLMVLLGKFKDKNGVPIQNINPKMSWPVAVENRVQVLRIHLLVGLVGLRLFPVLPQSPEPGCGAME